MTDCPICGTDVIYEIHVFEQVRPMLLCLNGHLSREVIFVAASHVGPLADLPKPPTPDEILRHAQGLGCTMLADG